MQTIARRSPDVEAISFDDTLTQEPAFEQALAYHTLALLQAQPTHLDRIAAGAAMTQVGRIQVRGGTGIIHPRREALRGYVCSSEGCECGAANGGTAWPCAHRYSMVLWQLATQHTYEAAREHHRRGGLPPQKGAV